MSKPSKQDILEAISDGVDVAITRMIRGITDCPSGDFWFTLKEAMEKAFEKVAEREIERRNDEKGESQ